MKALKRLYRRRIFILTVLFCLSMGIQPVIAQMSSPIGLSQLSAESLVAESKILYQRGDFQAAANMLQWAAAYGSQGDRLNEAIALSNLSLTYQELGEYSEAQKAIAQSLKLLGEGTEMRLLAQTLDIQGNLQQLRGQAQEAIETWEKAAQIYAKIGERGVLEQNEINQAQALQDLGLYPRACMKLMSALGLENAECEVTAAQLEKLKEGKKQVLGLNGFGNVLRVVGKLEQSEKILTESLQLAQALGETKAVTRIYLSLGNTARAQGDRESAANYYQQSAQSSQTPIGQMQGELAQLSILLEAEELPRRETELLSQSLRSKILNSDNSGRTWIYAQVNWANSMMKLLRKGVTGVSNNREIDRILVKAIAQARSLGDKRAEAYALLNRGRLYEEEKKWNQAKGFTQEGLSIAPTYEAPDIAYQLLWQLGRINNVRGNQEQAIANYSQAVNILESLRTDLVAISSEVQFDFRETVEPIYRELVGLLLQPDRPVKQSELKQARQAIESLQLAELDNFFKDACLNAKPAQIDRVDPTAAVLYPIILSDRLEVIAALPGQPLRHYSTILPQAEIEKTILRMRTTLTSRRMRILIRRFWQPSKKLYDWLIRPIEADLAASEVETIVFVLDGALRNIPMAALYDGDGYLAQKYSVALAPGLQLVDPKPLAREELNILTAGLSEARQGFLALPGVELELKRIQASAPTEVLLNESFTDANFQTAINAFPFPVVHLATHGEFGSAAADTFVLTWDDRINAKELEDLLRREIEDDRAIELLVLSACQTAAGDKRAALGLAGVAVRAGARSTVGSLWLVSDEATSLLMTRFYQELAKTEITKAEALRRAQESVLQDERFSHPYFWSAFILVGNWL
ncbi:MAG: CHAT domain-containing protein [Hormoscilla sp. GUM202]|nr:CHAT domain-containing protein [Hormoscilla sp. GUM202]